MVEKAMFLFTYLFFFKVARVHVLFMCSFHMTAKISVFGLELVLEVTSVMYLCPDILGLV